MTKIVQVATALAFTSVAWAQMFSLATPRNGDVLATGQQFTVEVDQPVAQGVFQPISLILSLERCSTTCSGSNDDILGEILYHGDFTPQRHENSKPPYQNFTFTLDDTDNTPAVLHGVHLFLVGAGPTAQIATTNVSVSIAAHDTSSAKFKRTAP